MFATTRGWVVAVGVAVGVLAVGSDAKAQFIRAPIPVFTPKAFPGYGWGYPTWGYPAWGYGGWGYKGWGWSPWSPAYYPPGRYYIQGGQKGFGGPSYGKGYPSGGVNKGYVNPWTTGGGKKY